MKTRKTKYINIASTFEDKRDSSKESNSSESISNDSSFEDSFDQGQSIGDALRYNIELMNKRQELIMNQVQYNGFKTIIYDSNAKLIR